MQRRWRHNRWRHHSDDTTGSIVLIDTVVLVMKESGQEDGEEVACGVVFGRSIRASMVIFQLALLDDNDADDDNEDLEDNDDADDEEEESLNVALLVFNFSTRQPEIHGNDSNQEGTLSPKQAQQQSSLRSSFRKCCTMGDLIVARGGHWVKATPQQQLQQPQQQPSNEVKEISSRCKRCYKVFMPLADFRSITLLNDSFTSVSGTCENMIDLKKYILIKQAARWSIQQWQQVAASCQRQLGLKGNSANSIHVPLSSSSSCPTTAKRTTFSENRTCQRHQQQQQRRPRRKHSPSPLHTKAIVDERHQLVDGVHDGDDDGGCDDESQRFNKRVVVKRIQREYLANFLIHMMAFKLQKERTDDSSIPEKELIFNPSSWHNKPSKTACNMAAGALCQQAIAHLNKGTGVLDVAGGAGHVSMALGLKGIQSTIVDPRAHAGMLPRRDRKSFAQQTKQHHVRQTASHAIINNAAQSQPSSMDGTNTQFETNVKSKRVGDDESTTTRNDHQEARNSQHHHAPHVTNVVEFRTFRAWFGVPPSGMEWHRHGECQIVCSVDHELIRNCSAIVALHPDEATDAIVDVAVQLRIPFCIVPCCVFARLYPSRRLRNNSPVCTYQDLLDYLQEKDASIQRSILPFEGKNTILWSIF